MDIEIDELSFMKAALQVEKDALEFFDSPGMASMGFAPDEDFLNEKREGIAKLEQQIAEMEEEKA